MKSLRIVFMGTPGFAAGVLKKVLDSQHQILAVVTAPDKPAGRGLKMQESEVKKVAIEHHCKILQPEKLKNPQFLEEIKSLNADLFLVVAFRMMPEILFNMPPLGSINLHGSLLPQYRGAAPINWAIINGEKKTGLTTFFIQQEIDTGSIIFKQEIDILENDTAGILHDKMMVAGGELVVKSLNAIASENYQKQAQTQTESLKHAPKIFKEDCAIDFNKNCNEVYNFVRGLSPFPTAFTILQSKILKIYFGYSEKNLTENISEETNGNWITDGKSFLKFKCKDGYFYATDVQIEGKKRMGIIEFLRGFRS